MRYDKTMTTIDQPNYEPTVIRLLLAHGFLPEKGQDTWVSSAKDQYAIAGFDDDDDHFRITVFRTSDDEMAYEAWIDLSVSDEASLERLMKAFDLSVFLDPDTWCGIFQLL